MEEIFVDCDPHGGVAVSVKGVKGSGCKKLTAEFEKSLGKEMSSEKTREYFEVERNPSRLQH